MKTNELKERALRRVADYHPVKGVLFMMGLILLVMAALIGMTALIWWIA